jgi:hypothetical protein
LEDYYYKELPDVSTHSILEDSEIQKRIAAMKKSDKDFLEKYPPDKWIFSIMKRYQEEISRKPGFPPIRMPLIKWVACLTSSLLIICAVMILVFNPNKNTSDSRAKGNEYQPTFKPTLNIYRKRDGQIVKIKNGSYAKAGDLLQITYTAPEKTYGVILSLDGRGTVTLHFPSISENSTLLRSNGENFLSNSFQLDDAPEFERFFFITSNTRIDINDIFHKVRLLGSDPHKARLQNLELNDSFSQVSLLILKGEDQ